MKHDLPLQSASRLAQLVAYCVATPGNFVTVIEGKPGIGKSAILRQSAAALGATGAGFLDWSLPHHGPEDFGFPTPRKEGLRFEAPAGVRDLSAYASAHGIGVWLWDELSNAPRSTQGGALKVASERLCGDERLPDEVKIVAAMNPPEHAADYQELSTALQNRAVWIRYAGPTRAEHNAYLLGNAKTFGTGDIPTSDEWRSAYAAMRGIFSAYGAAVFEDPDQDDVKARWPLAYASPRSWEVALRLAATCRAANDLGAMMDLMSGTIGVPQTMEFLAYYEGQDLIEVEALLADPSLFVVDKKRSDRTFAQLMACVAALDKKHSHAIDRWHAVWAVIESVCDAGQEDLCLPCCESLVAAKPSGNLLTSKVKIINRLAPMIGASLEVAA